MEVIDYFSQHSHLSGELLPMLKLADSTKQKQEFHLEILRKTEGHFTKDWAFSHDSWIEKAYQVLSYEMKPNQVNLLLESLDSSQEGKIRSIYHLKWPSLYFSAEEKDIILEML